MSSTVRTLIWAVIHRSLASTRYFAVSDLYAQYFDCARTSMHWLLIIDSILILKHDVMYFTYLFPSLSAQSRRVEWTGVSRTGRGSIRPNRPWDSTPSQSTCDDDLSRRRRDESIE
jgi:hypothetical protein